MIYWINQIANCRVGISGKPKGFDQLENDISKLCSENINWIISLLEDKEIEQYGLGEEEQLCNRYNIKFDRLAIQDNSIPGFQRFSDKIDHVLREIRNIENLVIHCNHGLGRSGLFVAGLLIKSGINLESALKIIAVKRGFSCPTSPSQLKLLKAYEAFLSRT